MSEGFSCFSGLDNLFFFGNIAMKKENKIGYFEINDYFCNQNLTLKYKRLCGTINIFQFMGSLTMNFLKICLMRLRENWLIDRVVNL